MKDRRKRNVQVNHERWLVSYADFVTLLFAFFVVLYASAQIDTQKANRLAGAIDTAFQQLGVFQDMNGEHVSQSAGLTSTSGVQNPDGAVELVRSPGQQPSAPQKEDFTSLRSELEEALAREIQRKEVALRTEPDGLVVSLQEMGFFDTGSATIKPGAEDAFARVAHILVEHSCSIRIEGHTDDVPIHTTQFTSNWELSTARATGLVRSLIETYRLPASRLSAAGYAEFHPAADNATAKGRQLNRRVDVVILSSIDQPERTESGHAAARDVRVVPSALATSSQNSNREP